MDDFGGSGGLLLIDQEKHCRYCDEKLHKGVSVCRVCLKYQNGVIEFFTKLSGLAIVASAVISLCLLGLTFVQLRGVNATLALATAAKDQAEKGERQAKEANDKLNSLVEKAVATTNRLGAVEKVLTQVDLATGGRKLCLSFKPPTWNDLGSGEGGSMPLYVPAKWSIQACANQATKLGASKFRVGCVFADHASIGAFVETTDSALKAKPIENCGW